MGALNHFDILKLKEKYNLSVFIETGTLRGDSLDYALSCGFDKLYSIEYNEQMFEFCKERFKNNPEVELICGTSVDGLNSIFENNKITGNILFWLDAHFYLVVGRDDSYYNIGEENLRYPLESEMEVIAKYRDGNDVIILDDLRMYEDGNYGNGPLFHFVTPPKERNTKFIPKLFPHSIASRDWSDEGYLTLTPF